MAYFLYNGTRVLNMIQRGGPQGPPANDRYLLAGGPIGNWFNTFHINTPTTPELKFNIGNYLAGPSFFPITTCGRSTPFVTANTYNAYPASTATAANPTWFNVSIYSPINTNGSIQVVGDNANVANGRGSPNFLYCILVGGGGGGGGGGRTRGTSSGTAGQGGGGGGGKYVVSRWE